ncbi:MAG: glycosyl hydrolase 53 family protein, partial [Bacteroidota bacterium]
DFHYSDTWADPGHQEVPAAWLEVVNDLELLGDSLYRYTYRTLELLHQAGLLPDMVQVGNEINNEILQHPDQAYPQIDWARNVALLNRGLQAVDDVAKAFDTPIEKMLHIAQPEHARWWFAEATENALTNYDWIGLSYYPQWSTNDLAELTRSVAQLRTLYGKQVMIVETAYPFTLAGNDAAHNLLGDNALLEDYPATEAGQLAYLVDLEKAVKAGDGAGLIYWEPAWISTSCRTQWGQGSHWENAALFDFDGQITEGMRYFGGK